MSIIYLGLCGVGMCMNTYLFIKDPGYVSIKVKELRGDFGQHNRNIYRPRTTNHVATCNMCGFECFEGKTSHCLICDTCVIEKDHHCQVFGKCIG